MNRLDYVYYCFALTSLPICLNDWFYYNWFLGIGGLLAWCWSVVMVSIVLLRATREMMNERN